MRIFPATRHRKHISFFVLLLALTLALGACSLPTDSPPTPTPLATPIPTTEPISVPPTATLTPEPTPTPEPLRVSLPDAWPQVERLTAALEDAGFVVVEDAGEASAVVRALPLAEAAGDVLARRVFAVVAPFATVRDEITLAELQERWSGQAAAPLLVTEQAAGLATLFGAEPAQIISASDLLAQLDQQPDALGILPFDQLDPTFKVLAVDGVNPLDNQLAIETYPLALALMVDGPGAAEVVSHLQGVLPASNREPDRLTTLVMTGVTAMSRGTAARMEEHGYTYPAEVISDTLRAADITHVSNEVPFIDGCKVNNIYMNLVLCSDYPYWQALEAMNPPSVTNKFATSWLWFHLFR